MSENVEIFNSKKEFSEDIKLNVFKLIEQGASITKGELFKYFNKLIG
jgi:cytochrome c-type biogenesis protein CcmH/NrfF